MMRADVILREAWRNVRSGASRAGWLSVALVVAISLLSCAELMSVSALDKRARDYRSAGASVRILKVEAGVEPEQCEALTRSGGVLSAGAIRPVAPIGITSLPGVATPAFEMTPGFQEVLGLDRDLNSGVLLSEPLARRWNIRPGDSLETDRGSVAVAAVFPYPEDDGRDSRLANAVLLPSLPTGLFDECWVDVWPSTAAFDSLIRSVRSNGPGEATAPVITLNATLGSVFAGADEYQNRLTRYSPAASLLLGFIIGFVGGTRRRLEFASSLHAGMTNRDLTLIALVETSMWAGIGGLVSATGLAFVAHIFVPLIADALYGHSLLICGLGSAGAITGNLVLVASSRESGLFRYFKERS